MATPSGTTAMVTVLTCRCLTSSHHTSLSPHPSLSPRSEPCKAARNSSLLCPPGYWLCEDQRQCILRGYSFSRQLSEGFISNFCDGVNHCKDGSDEQFSQCLQVSTRQVVVGMIFITQSLYSWQHSSPSVGPTLEAVVLRYNEK